MKKPAKASDPGDVKAYCIFCGSTVGQVSDATGEIVTAVYDCPRCMLNYCDQCSYEESTEGKQMQLCLRCDGQLEKVM